MVFSLGKHRKNMSPAGERLSPLLKAYIDENYIGEEAKYEVEECFSVAEVFKEPLCEAKSAKIDDSRAGGSAPMPSMAAPRALFFTDEESETTELTKKLNERLAHTSDTFSEYLLYLIETKGMKNAEVYNRAIVDKRYFSKIKNNKNFHPEKLKALCLCVGAMLSLDETKDLLARAGYALSPCDLTDIIFSFYIENKHYDVIDIDIQLEEHGLPCIIY